MTVTPDGTRAPTRRENKVVLKMCIGGIKTWDAMSAAAARHIRPTPVRRRYATAVNLTVADPCPMEFLGSCSAVSRPF
jgi:hypothetical protein